MNRKNKISTGNFLRSLILLMMMGWMGSAWAQDATTNIATGNKGSVYFDYNGIRVNGEPEKDKTYHITYNAGEHASGTSPEATWVEEGDLFKIPRNTTLITREIPWLYGRTAREANTKSGNVIKPRLST